MITSESRPVPATLEFVTVPPSDMIAFAKPDMSGLLILKGGLSLMEGGELLGHVLISTSATTKVYSLALPIPPVLTDLAATSVNVTKATL
jgi:hypothetical protein